jgi:hypothetical protein
VVESDRGAIEHAPEPDERLEKGVALGVNITIVFGLQSNVGGIEGELEDVEGELGGEGKVEASAMRTTEHELMQIVADDLAAEGDVLVTRELVVEGIYPAGVDFFGFASRFDLSVLIARHMFWIISRFGRMQKQQ